VRAVLRQTKPFPSSRRAGGCAPHLIVLLLFAWQKVCAQLAPAEDYFNSGAQFYISNNIPSALERVEAGLKTFPNDEKLKKLEELLKQQQQQQSQQNQQQNQKQQNQQNQAQQQQQKNQQQQSSAKNSQDQQKQDQQKQNQSEQQKAEQQKQQEQQQAAAQNKQDDNKNQQNAEGQPVKAGQMTPEEAKKLLDAQKGDEQVLPWKPQDKPEDQNKPVKDW
jgi:Ca-activated chloride channel family protein